MDQGFTKSQAEQDARGIIGNTDENHDGVIGFNEFAQIWQRKLLSVNMSYIHAVFSVLDENGDGTIDKAELAKVLNMNAETEADELGDIIKEVDGDGDGQISFEEFKKAMLEQDLTKKTNNVGAKLDVDELKNAAQSVEVNIDDHQD